MSVEQKLLDNIPTSFTDHFSQKGRDRIEFATAIKTLNTTLRPFLPDLAGVREYPVDLIVEEYQDSTFGRGSIKLKAQLRDLPLGPLVLTLDHRRQMPIIFGTGQKTNQKTWIVEHRATMLNIEEGEVVLIQTGLGRWQNNDPHSEIYTADLDTAYPKMYGVVSFFEKAKTLTYVASCIQDPRVHSKETPPIFYN